MKKLVITLFLLFSYNLNLFGQGFEVNEIGKKLIKSHRAVHKYKSEYKKYRKDAYHAVKDLPKKYKKDGSQDYTPYLQYSLDNNNIVLLPNFPISVSDIGLTINNDQILLFQPNSKIKLIPSNKNGYNILRIYNVTNVKIFYANIKGDKYKHLNNEGQWGFAIGIKSAKKIEIFSPYITQTWGDGIYIGQSNNIPSENISIFNAVIDDVRRNGISITSGKKVNIEDSYISNTNGNSPESGLDIEPNTIYDQIEDIYIKNLTTFNNKWSGILFVFEQFKSEIPKKISIEIDGHKDIKSLNAIAFHGYKSFEGKGNLSGIIRINRLSYGLNKEKFFFYKTNFSMFEIISTEQKLEEKFKNYKVK